MYDKTLQHEYDGLVRYTNINQLSKLETVQLYIYDEVASVTQPLKKLKAFQKVFLRKGESKQVKFPITINELKFFNSELKWIAEPGDFMVYIGGNSIDVKAANFKLK